MVQEQAGLRGGFRSQLTELCVPLCLLPQEEKRIILQKHPTWVMWSQLKCRSEDLLTVSAVIIDISASHKSDGSRHFLSLESFCSVRSMMSRGRESDPVCVTLPFGSVKPHLVSTVFVGIHVSHLVKKLNCNNRIVQKSAAPYALIPPYLKA